MCSMSVRSDTGCDPPPFPRRPGKAGWERRFLSVDEGRLTLYSEEPSPGGPAPSPLQTIDLRSGHVHVDADVAYSEVPQLARRDLPYVFKVRVPISGPLYRLIVTNEVLYDRRDV